MTYLVYTCTSSRHFFEKSYFNIFLKSRFKSRTCFLTSVEARADIVVLVVVVVDSGIASGAAGQPSGEMGIPLTHIADEVRGRSIFLALRRLSLFFLPQTVLASHSSNVERPFRKLLLDRSL